MLLYLESLSPWACSSSPSLTSLPKTHTDLKVHIPRNLSRGQVSLTLPVKDVRRTAIYSGHLSKVRTDDINNAVTLLEPFQSLSANVLCLKILENQPFLLGT